jgi:predicted nucleotidyltransferase
VDAEPLLAEVARQMHAARLEAVLIGNAAAAIQGAPVTTVDFDFLFRKTPRNIEKMKAVARALQATILRPYYPASDLYRIVRDDDGLQVDLMTTIHGVRSFAGLRARASSVLIGEVPVLVASLDDIIKSKRAAKRPRDLAVLPTLEAARGVKETCRTWAHGALTVSSTASPREGKSLTAGASSDQP